MADSFVTPWTTAFQAPLSMGFLSQKYWSGLPFPSPGALPQPGIEPTSPAWQADSSPLSHKGKDLYVTDPALCLRAKLQMLLITISCIVFCVW